MWLPADHLRGIWHNAVPRWVATSFSSVRLTPPDSEVDDLNLRVRGRAADRVLELMRTEFQTAVPHSQVGIDIEDEDFGSITELISHEGRFVADGGNFGFHQAIVQRVVDRYRRFVERAERHALRWEMLPEGGARPYGRAYRVAFQPADP